jgi:hypothetical protein
MAASSAPKPRTPALRFTAGTRSKDPTQTRTGDAEGVRGEGGVVRAPPVEHETRDPRDGGDRPEKRRAEHELGGAAASDERQRDRGQDPGDQEDENVRARDRASPRRASRPRFRGAPRRRDRPREDRGPIPRRGAIPPRGAG